METSSIYDQIHTYQIEKGNIDSSIVQFLSPNFRLDFNFASRLL